MSDDSNDKVCVAQIMFRNEVDLICVQHGVDQLYIFASDLGKGVVPIDTTWRVTGIPGWRCTTLCKDQTRANALSIEALVEYLVQTADEQGLSMLWGKNPSTPGELLELTVETQYAGKVPPCQ